MSAFTQRLQLISVAMGSSMFSVFLVLACTAGAGDKGDGSSDTQGTTEDSEPTNDTSPPEPPNPSVLDCTQWEMTYWYGDRIGQNCQYELGNICTMPEGWEPFSGGTGQDTVYLRRCTSQSG